MDRNKVIDDVAYRLRVATKRTDLPEDVVRLLADAYYEIWLGKERVQVLNDKCDSLLSTNVELEARIENIKEGFEGSCTACEPVGEMNKTLRAERDEARRLYCEEWAFTIELERGEAGHPPDLALEKGWDCYLQRKKSDAALDELARLDEELGLIEPPNKEIQ